MKCFQCGTSMVTRKENYLYDECGLPGITLMNIEVRRCPKCGEHEAAIPRIEALHRTIAHALARKPSRLVPQEIRFLRKYLGWNGKGFAEHMCVEPETVSRWESGTVTMGAQAEALLRVMALTMKPADDYTFDYLRAIRSGESKPLRLGMKVSGREWEAAA